MAQLDQSYETDSLPKSDFEPIPTAVYDYVIHSAEVVNVKNNGQMIKIRLDVTGPTHQGRVVFDNVTIKNSSAQAVEIGHKRLGEYNRACGLSRLTDTDQLVGCPVRGRTGIEKSDQYGDRNRINAIMPPSGSSPMPKTGGAPAPAVAPSGIPAGLKSGGAKPGWAAPKE
jgi:hypothetical protein